MKKITITLERLQTLGGYQLTRLTNAVNVTDGVREFRVNDSLIEKQVEALNRNKHYTVVITQ